MALLPEGGTHLTRRSTNMALLTRGGLISRAGLQTWPSCRGADSSHAQVYKHGPPAGGRTHLTRRSTNMALLPEGGHISRAGLQTWPPCRRADTSHAQVYKHGPPDEKSNEKLRWLLVNFTFPSD